MHLRIVCAIVACLAGTCAFADGYYTQNGRIYDPSGHALAIRGISHFGSAFFDRPTLIVNHVALPALGWLGSGARRGGASLRRGLVDGGGVSSSGAGPARISLSMSSGKYRDCLRLSDPAIRKLVSMGCLHGVKVSPDV